MVLLHLMIGEIECFCPFTCYSHLPKTSAFLHVMLESSFSMSFHSKNSVRVKSLRHLFLIFFRPNIFTRVIAFRGFDLVKRNLRQITWISTSLYFLWDILIGSGFVASIMVSVTTAKNTSGFSQRRTVFKSTSDY